MSITEVSVRRPAAIVMAIILVFALGIIGYNNLGADLLPPIVIPIITVSTTYNGAGVVEIENDVVKPVEDAVSRLRGIDTISSTSSIGRGKTRISFTMETDMNTAFMDVQQALAGSQSHFRRMLTNL